MKKHDGRYDWGEDVFESIRSSLAKGVSPKTIAAQLNLPNVSMVYDINSGKTHKSDRYQYPIQKQQNRFSLEEVEQITNEIISTNKSLAKIAREHNIHKSSIIALKNGKWEKYRLPNYTYPLRTNN